MLIFCLIFLFVLSFVLFFDSSINYIFWHWLFNVHVQLQNAFPTKLILNHIPPLTLTSKKKYSYIICLTRCICNNEKKSIFFERLIILPPKLTFQTYFHDSPSSFTNSSSFFTGRMYCYHFVYTHAFSLQKQLLIFRERTFIPLAQLLSILLIMWFQNICSANLIPNLFYNVGEHGRSLANQIFIRLREKKNQPVSPKRT